MATKSKPINRPLKEEDLKDAKEMVNDLAKKKVIKNINLLRELLKTLSTKKVSAPLEIIMMCATLLNVDETIETAKMFNNLVNLKILKHIDQKSKNNSLTEEDIKLLALLDFNKKKNLIKVTD